MFTDLFQPNTIFGMKVVISPNRPRYVLPEEIIPGVQVLQACLGNQAFVTRLISGLWNFLVLLMYCLKEKHT